MIRFSKAPHRKITTLAAVFGLLLQAAALAFPFTIPVPDAFGPAAAGAVSDTFRTVVICAGQGLKRIVLDADGRPVEPPSGDNRNGFCPFCLTHAGYALASPAFAILLPAFIGQMTSWPPRALTADRGQPSKIYRNRAPPFQA